MAIFSTFLKSPPESPTARHVPNGGLGGLVQLRGKEKKSPKAEIGKGAAPRTQTDPTARQRKQPPPPIRVNSVDVSSAPIQSAPLAKDEDRTSPAALWKISHPPVKSATGTAFVVAEVEVQDLRSLSSKLLWKDSAHTQAGTSGQTGDRNESSSTGGPKKISSPVELPGSLLLPDQGFGLDSSPTSPASSNSRSRANSERSPQPSPSKSSKSGTPVSKDSPNMKSASRGPKSSRQQKPKDRSSSLPEIKTPTQENIPASVMSLPSNVNVLSAEELIRVLPKMKARKLATDWLPAMEKEIGKYKGLLHMYSNRTEVNFRHIQSICLDLKNLLIAMKSSAGTPSEQFAKAQADIDARQLTDLEKLQHSEDELQEALQACDVKGQEIDIRATEFQHLKTVLYQVVATLGGCIRNNLAFKLYHSPEGLSEDVVKVLRAYKQWDDHTLKTFPSLVPAELFEIAEKKAKELKAQVTECEELIAEQQKTIVSAAAAHDDLEHQLEHCREEVKVHRDRTQHLEAEIVALQAELQNAEGAHGAAWYHGVKVGDDQPVELAGDNIITMYARQSDQLEQRNSVISEQSAIIEDLMRQVNEMHSTHGQTDTDPTHSSTSLGSTSSSIGQDSIERSPSSASRRRLLGSRTLSRAITPISRSMSYLLSPHDTEPMDLQADLDVNSQQPKDGAHIPLTKSNEHSEGKRSSRFWEQKDVRSKKNIITPYPRDSIMGVDNLNWSTISARQNLHSNPSYPPTLAELDVSSKDMHAAVEDEPRNRTPVQPTASTHARQKLVGTEIPSIASRMQQVPAPISHTDPVRPGNTMRQGLRNEQLPLRLLSDTNTMSEQEKKTLSLISERSELHSATHTPTTTTTNIDTTRHYSEDDDSEQEEK